MGMPGQVALDPIAATVNGQVDDLCQDISPEGIETTW